jgi:RNA polymerase sigma factor (TIGR02999 family)
MSDVTVILEAVCRGENAAAEELLPLVYEELRRLAAVQMAGESGGDTLQPTALVHEAWLRLVKEEGRTWRNRAHFFRTAALAMRRILVDRARRRLSLKRGSGAHSLPLDDLDVPEATPDDRILLVDESLNRLEKEDPESARIIVLKFFGGLTNREVGKALGVTERSVEHQWSYAKAALLDLMQKET